MAHLMYDIWVESNRLKYIREATVVLEYAYSLSPSNFHIKLLLLKFYHMLGKYIPICMLLLLKLNYAFYLFRSF